MAREHLLEACPPALYGGDMIAEGQIFHPAHHALGLDPPASCRLSFTLYNTLDEVDRAVDALAAVVGGRLPRPLALA